MLYKHDSLRYSYIHCHDRVQYIVGSSSDQVEPKAIKLIFVAFLPTTQH